MSFPDPSKITHSNDYKANIQDLVKNLPNDRFTLNALEAIQFRLPLPKCSSSSTQREIQALENYYHAPNLSEEDKAKFLVIFSSKLSDCEKSLAKEGLEKQPQLTPLIESMVPGGLDSYNQKLVTDDLTRIVLATSSFEEAKVLLNLISSMIPQGLSPEKGVYLITGLNAAILRTTSFKESTDLLNNIKNKIPLDASPMEQYELMISELGV